MHEIESWPATELDRWKAYHAVEPIPPPGWHEAQICSLLANVNRKEGAKASSVEDFMPQGKAAPRKPQSAGEVKEIMRRVQGVLD